MESLDVPGFIDTELVREGFEAAARSAEERKAKKEGRLNETCDYRLMCGSHRTDTMCTMTRREAHEHNMKLSRQFAHALATGSPRNVKLKKWCTFKGA
jgi:hypothetical protein